MRPLRHGLAVALLLIGGAASAQTSFTSKVQVYVDDDHTTVVSPLVKAEADVSDKASVNASYVADVVTSASVDIVTQASKTTIHDTRHQVAFGGSHIFGSLTAQGEYLFSTENDYHSHNLSLSVEKRLFDNATTFALAYSLSLNTVGRAGDANYARSLTANELSLTLSQVLTPKLLVQLGYTFGAANGMQASSYRFVPVRMDPTQVPQFWVPETDPDARYRHSVVIGGNLHVFDDSAIQADYRFYTDTWGIVSHTVQLRYLTNLTPRLELRLRERFYTQSGASFYQANYPEPEQFMTIDRELSRLWSETVGVKLSYLVATDVEAEAKLDAFYYSYPDFPLLPSRTGVNFGLGLRVTY